MNNAQDDNTLTATDWPKRIGYDVRQAYDGLFVGPRHATWSTRRHVAKILAHSTNSIRYALSCDRIVARDKSDLLFEVVECFC